MGDFHRLGLGVGTIKLCRMVGIFDKIHYIPITSPYHNCSRHIHQLSSKNHTQSVNLKIIAKYDKGLYVIVDYRCE